MSKYSPQPLAGEDDAQVLEKAIAPSTRVKVQLKPPPLYRVLLHNDDYTTMEFVVWILETVFAQDHAQAVKIMLQVHERGIGLAGVYSYEVAEAKVAQVSALAQQEEFPLLCTLEPDI